MGCVALIMLIVILVAILVMGIKTIFTEGPHPWDYVDFEKYEKKIKDDEKN